MSEIELVGSKIVEVPYFASQIDDLNKSVLVVGERLGTEGVSETLKVMGIVNVTTTDIVPVESGSWLDNNRGDWKHIQSDFTEFDESIKYDYIVSISAFEHFGFWFAGNRMASGMVDLDSCRWNHDIRGITKGCRLLRDEQSKLIITVPAGPYMNYEPTGEPFLRSYDYIRQNIIKKEIGLNGFRISDEKFFMSEDFFNWAEVSPNINFPSNYNLYNSISPNVLWCFTIMKT